MSSKRKKFVSCFVGCLFVIFGCSANSNKNDSRLPDIEGALDAAQDAVSDMNLDSFQDAALDVAIDTAKDFLIQPADAPLIIKDVMAVVDITDDIGKDVFLDLSALDLMADSTADSIPTDFGIAVAGTWVAVSLGTFVMGSYPSEVCRTVNETTHVVTLSHNFTVTTTEITQNEFYNLMGYNPSYFTGCNNCPVEMINWHEASAYCNALSILRGFGTCYDCQGTGASVLCAVKQTYDGSSRNIYECPGYRLPTEAEWEYLYRAGTTTPFYNGAITACMGSDPNADLIAWYYSNAGSTTHEVGHKHPNKWFLYDMAGNVLEWCHDWYQNDLGATQTTDPWGPSTGTERVIRGGSILNNPAMLRAARRSGLMPYGRSNGVGFRVVRTL